MASIEVFCCYAHEDASLLEKLKAHLTLLKRQNLIAIWTDTNISPGSNWEQEIQKHLNTANIILLLVSSDFMASDYCYSKEMMLSIERHERGEACVIPVILRPVYWQGAPFARLQALPTGAKPIISSSWHSLDEALLDVVNGIGAAIQYFQTSSLVKNSQLRVYISQEIRKGRSISEVLKECDPSLDMIFQIIIQSARDYISEAIRMGKPTRKAFRESSPILEYLFEVALSQEIALSNAGKNDYSVLKTQIEKLLKETSAVGDGDLSVQAEVTPDTFGVVADTINWLIQEFAKTIIRIQKATAIVTTSTDDLHDMIIIQRVGVKTIAAAIRKHNFISDVERDRFLSIVEAIEDFSGTIEREELRTMEIRSAVDKLYDSISTWRLTQLDVDGIDQDKQT